MSVIKLLLWFTIILCVPEVGRCVCVDSKRVEARGKPWVSFPWSHLPTIFPFGVFSMLNIADLG